MNQATAYVIAGQEPGRLGHAHPRVAPHGLFRASDGPIFIIAGTVRQSSGLCRVVGLEHLPRDERFATNAARVRNREDLTDLLGDALGKRSVNHWITTLGDAGVPCGPVNGVGDAFRLAERLGLQPVVEMSETDRKTCLEVANPLAMSDSPATYRIVPPALGADTPRVIDWLR